MRLLFGGEPAFELIGEAPDGETAVRLADELRPDVILMDVKMPGAFDGIEATRRIVGSVAFSSRPPLVIGLSGSGELAGDMHAAGAIGFIDKSSTSDLIAAIKTVVNDNGAAGTAYM
jgi:DNA-binding NarL/FixJ family response regulator